MDTKMEEPYNFQQYIHFFIIHIGKTVFNLDSYFSSSRKYPKDETTERGIACMVYDNRKTEMLSWGDPLFEKDDKSHIRITNFRDGLYHAFKKEYNLKYKVTGGHNYVFVVPSEWEEEIREDLIRPIFISAGLISKEDHKDRLLFLTDLECIFYNSEDSDITKYLSNRGKTTVLCRLSFIEYDIASIKLNSVSTASNLFDDPYPLLFPNVLQSSTTYMAISDIKSSINLFLREKLFPADTDTDQARIISKIVESIYNINFRLSVKETIYR
ncbi:hypothetical protein BDF21DRAFT_37888 [Thamnidium elegans]|nr:hypothetical protein BDF21DRAFT_37888 [Thamnidium elegans]